MPEKLKPCPFCGADGFFKFKQGINITGMMFEKHRIVCSRCKNKTKWEPFINLAITVWNKRKETP